MPRAKDIGWQHGKMIGGHRHHVQCNYCHRTMIGGVTRFKKHLASKRGEIRGCEAVPTEVRELIKKHLAAGKTKKASEKKKRKVDSETLNEVSSEDKDTESDESDREAAARLESLRTLHEAEIAHQQATIDHQQSMAGTREFFDAFSSGQYRDEQGSAPPRATDLGWAHGMMVNGDRQKIKCRYCHKVILGGGISRLKQHLAGERGNIAPCEKVPEDVKALIQHHLGFKVLERLKKQKESETSRTPLISNILRMEEGFDDDPPSPGEAFARTSTGRRRRKESKERSSGRGKRHKKEIIPIATPITQHPPHLGLASQESIDQADTAVAKFMYDAGIPLNAANSMYFQQMANAIAAVGPGYKMPSYQALRGKLLNRSVHETGELCQELRKSWEVTGCTVMADRWMDRSGREIVNFFVYCSKGTMFLKSVDASEITRSSEALLRLFESIVQDVGPKNIVQFITDSTPNYKSAGKMLMQRYKTFFWSVCAAHCIDLMLRELEKMEDVRKLLAKAKRICQFIYNHTWALNLMRKRTGGRDIIHPAISGSLTSFLTLQSIMSLKEPLHQMFTSNTWMQSSFSKLRTGYEVTEIIVDPLFWSLCDQILKITKPLITVLHVIDSEERPPMGYIYEAMEKAKKCMAVGLSNKEFKYLPYLNPYLNVIDHIWEEELHSPLHAAAFYLNPSIFYNSSFCNNKVIQKGLLDCIETLEPNLTAQDLITKQIQCYEGAIGDFSRPVALRGRESLAPATWWSLYAVDYPDLQRFAFRILSQTCSGASYERKWLMFERTTLMNYNRLEHDKLNDLIFVHYNLRLQDRASSAVNMSQMKGTHDPTCLEDKAFCLGDWIKDPGVLESADRGWSDEALPNEAISFGTKVMKVDDSIYSTNEGGSEETDSSDENVD